MCTPLLPLQKTPLNISLLRMYPGSFIYWDVGIGDWVCAAGETDKGARVRLARVWAHAYPY